MAGMKSITLADEDWDKILMWIARSVVWAEANPLLVKIQAQRQGLPPDLRANNNNGGKEAQHEHVV